MITVLLGMVITQQVVMVVLLLMLQTVNVKPMEVTNQVLIIKFTVNLIQFRHRT